MWSEVGNKARLMIFALVAGGVGTLLATVLLLHTALHEITEKSNQMEAARAGELLDASVRSARTRMSAMALDNSVWDDAFKYAYDPKQAEAWANSAWGPGSQDAKPYDGMFLLDETGKIAWGAFRGQRYRETTPDKLGGGLKTLLADMDMSVTHGTGVVSGLTRTEFGPALVSVSFIRPSTYATPPLKGRRYLIMTRHLTPPVVSAMGDAAGLSDLHLLDQEEPRGTAYILDAADGEQIGRLAWKPRLPGAAAAKAGRGQIELTTLLVVALVLILVTLSAYAVLRLARNETAARRVSMIDSLSQLPNRRAFYEQLQLAAGKTESCLAAVAFVDLDGFKDINDVHGHASGDLLIRELATKFRELATGDVFLARMGGDEFALLVTGASSIQASRAFCDKVLSYLSTPVKIDGHHLKVGASLGIATGNLKWVSPDEIVRRADVAMYHSKANGKGQVSKYDPKFDAERLKTQAIEKGLHLGLERDEFDVIYQPIVDAKTWNIIGVEALVRWPGRPEGQLFPDQFIPIAETSGVIHELGRYILRRACQEVATLEGIRLSVNISPVQFQDIGFEAAVKEILTSTGFPADRLEFDLTEGYLVENPTRVQAVIETLKAEGITFALDDFGTGNSSIGQLKRFQFDRIKIDRSLSNAIGHDNQASVLIAGTVNIARALSMEITAEGVESENHAMLLKLAGCTSLQGYHFGRPMTLGGLHALLTQPTQKAAEA